MTGYTRGIPLILAFLASAALAGVPIPNLPAISSVQGSDVIIDTQGDVTGIATVNQLMAFVSQNGAPNLNNATGSLTNLNQLPQAAGYTALCNNTASQTYVSACTNITIVTSNPVLGQTYGDGSIVSVEYLANGAGSGQGIVQHVGNNFLIQDYGAQFSYGAEPVLGQMIVSGPIIGGRGAGSFNTTINHTTLNTAGGGESYDGVGGAVTATVNDNGTGVTAATAKGSLFGGNMLAILKNGATDWQGNIGLEVDTEMDTGSSSFLNVGIQAVKQLSSAVYGAGEDAAFLVGAQSTVTAPWKMGYALSNRSDVGAFALDTTASAMASYQVGTITYGVDFVGDGTVTKTVTCSSYCFRSTGFSVDGSGNETAATLKTTQYVGATSTSLSLQANNGATVMNLTTTGGNQVTTSPLITAGPPFSATSSCGGTATFNAGGPAGGYFTASAGGSNCQFTITIGGSSPVTAPHGWYCSGVDFTSHVNAVQYTQTTTACVLQVATVTANDIILWGVVTGY